MGNSLSRHGKRFEQGLRIVNNDIPDRKQDTFSSANGHQNHASVQQVASQEPNDCKPPSGPEQTLSQQRPFLPRNDVQQQIPPYVNQSSLIDLPPLEEKKKTPSRILQPSEQDLFLAACKFDEVARRAKLEYAFVGGYSARIFGSRRPTSTLDVLIKPRMYGNESDVTLIVDELFNNSYHVLTFTRPNRQEPVVLIHDDVGVGINFLDCVSSPFDFPDLVAEPVQDETPWNPDEPEPTWSYLHIQPAGVSTGSQLPVLLPRLLLQQRLIHFTRPQEQDELNTRGKNDVRDIAAYLTNLYRSEHQSFTDEEAFALLPKVRDVLRFADLHCLPGLDVDKWCWINIPLQEGDWRG